MKYIITVLVAFSLAFSSCRVDTEKRFMLSPKEALAIANNQDNILTSKKLADIINNEDSMANYRFVDLRDPLDFETGHIAEAVNIPFSSMSKNNSCGESFSSEFTHIIYGSSTEEVVFAGFALQQIGINNFLILYGDYDYIKNNIIDNFNPKTAILNPETSRYDFKEIMASGNTGEAPKVEAPAMKGIPIIKKKKEAAGGGCG